MVRKCANVQMMGSIVITEDQLMVRIHVVVAVFLAIQGRPALPQELEKNQARAVYEQSLTFHISHVWAELDGMEAVGGDGGAILKGSFDGSGMCLKHLLMFGLR